MDIRSIKRHLQPYSISQKRRTTINHAFASAVAPVEAYDELKIGSAMKKLGQNPDNLFCVYCGVTAETWDHLVGLVKNNEFSGYGHTLGNLVPACKPCNSKKGNKDWLAFSQLSYLTALPGSKARRQRLQEYIRLYHVPVLSKPPSRKILLSKKKLKLIKEKILDLLKEADTIVKAMQD